MFKSLGMNNFRCFQNKTLILGKYITVLAGRNSTGKSTILGMLGNSSELKVKDGVPYNIKQFRAEFSELFNGSEKFDPSGSDKYMVTHCNKDMVIDDYRKFRITWQSEPKEPKEKRFHIVPYRKDDTVNTSAKLKFPVLYLGLSRLFPIGEANHDKLQANVPKFIIDEHKNWFIDNYKSIISMYQDFTNISCVAISEFDTRRAIGINTDNYDYLTNSSGQDNLGQILFALLSFRKIKEHMKEKWDGGLLLIDELDATLHPAAQNRLFDLMINESRAIGYQIVFTTHSTSLLKHICNKIVHNNDQINNNIELYYFTTANRALDIRRNIDFTEIEGDLLVQSTVQNRTRIKLYSEDRENRWFTERLIKEYIGFVDILDVSLGCSELANLCKADPGYFGNCLIIFDGDVENEIINIIPETIRKRLNNIIKLPGTVRPEQVFYDYLLSLPPEHEYWSEASVVGFSWTYFMENGPQSKNYVKYPEKDKERDKYKMWFIEHQDFFDSTRLYEYWAKDNEETVINFRNSFVLSYNNIASRLFLNKIVT